VISELFVIAFDVRESYLLRCNELHVPSSKTTVTEYQISREIIWYDSMVFVSWWCILIVGFVTLHYF